MRPTSWLLGWLTAGLGLALPGCAGLRHAQLPPQPLAAGELARLDGDYQNASPRFSYFLAEALFSTRLPDSVHEHDYRLHLVLQARSEQTIRVQLFRHDTLLAEAVRRGRVKDGWFLLKPQYTFWGLPPLAWSFSASRSWLALGRTDTLLLDNSRSSYGNVLLALYAGVRTAVTRCLSPGSTEAGSLLDS